MPNWCYTRYVVDGDRKQIEELHSIMAELESMESPLHENGFGTTWLGNLVIKLGGDWKKIYCRGSWENLDLTESGLYFTTETAWNELNEVRHLIEEKFPKLLIYYQAEEPGMGIYQTNDNTGQYFPEEFMLDVEDMGPNYIEDLDQLCEQVEDITGSKHLNTMDSCYKALKSYSKRNGDCYYSLVRFEVVDD